MTVTLGLFLQESVGSFVVIELKDETAIEGKIVFVEPKSLNIELTDIVVYRRGIKKLKALSLQTLFIKGRYIRFVHFEGYQSVLNLLKKSLRKK
ncbi:hypothetical protein ACQ4LE_001325 [Meloidogyne hapla]|uniref:Sm domain-containing protein n=1 Tax=Meloidogyne hapla TaxID=6305 RepID=A0A1I8AXX2_MELHA